MGPPACALDLAKPSLPLSPGRTPFWPQRGEGALKFRGKIEKRPKLIPYTCAGLFVFKEISGISGTFEDNRTPKMGHHSIYCVMDPMN